MTYSQWMLILSALCFVVHACAEDPSPNQPPSEQRTSSDMGPLGRSGGDAALIDMSAHDAAPPQRIDQRLDQMMSEGGVELSQGGDQPPETPVDTGLRVIRIHTVESPSWVAWFEVEVLGGYLGEVGQVRNLTSEASLSASSSLDGEEVERIADGDLSTAWNSGGAPPAWVELTFPAAIELSALRLYVAQSPEGDTAHEVLLGPSVAALEVAHRFSSLTSAHMWLEYRPETSPEPPEPPSSSEPSPLLFNIIIRQTQQSCASCGIFFDWEEEQAFKPRLEVSYEREGQRYSAEFQHGRQGMDNAHSIWIESRRDPPDSARHQMLIKQAPLRNALLRVDASEIPPDAVITDAKLHLHLHSHEGLANSDRTSVLTVYECPQEWDWETVTWSQATSTEPWERAGGVYGRVIREIHAGRDMHERGFNKGRPSGFFDFTEYIQLLQSERGQ